MITPGALPAALAGTRILFVGESHTDMETHRVELRVIEELVRAGRRVFVGLEMYPYTEQKSLDLWSSGELTEASFLEASRWYKNWGYHWNYYRDIFLFAQKNRLRLFAINTPREVVAAVRKKGFQGLTDEERAHIPARIDTDSAEHLRLFKASFSDDSFHAGMSEEDWKSMETAQCTWDATMGYNAVQALQKFGDEKTIMVVLIGAGHVQYGLGAERQARSVFPGKMASLLPVPVSDEKHGPVTGVNGAYSNFVWGIPAEDRPSLPDARHIDARLRGRRPVVGSRRGEGLAGVAGGRRGQGPPRLLGRRSGQGQGNPRPADSRQELGRRGKAGCAPRRAGGRPHGAFPAGASSACHTRSIRIPRDPLTRTASPGPTF